MNSKLEFLSGSLYAGGRWRTVISITFLLLGYFISVEESMRVSSFVLLAGVHGNDWSAT